MADIPDNAPAPRLCHIVKWPDFDGYGFNLHADKSRPGQHIGKVDNDSPAEMAGLKEYDKIIEVNGVNIFNENHKQVVQRIKSIENETRLLVVDRETDQWYKDHNIVVSGSLSNLVSRSSIRTPKDESPAPTPTPSEEAPATTNGHATPHEDSGSLASAESSHESESSTQPQSAQATTEDNAEPISEVVEASHIAKQIEAAEETLPASHEENDDSGIQDESPEVSATSEALASVETATTEASSASQEQMNDDSSDSPGQETGAQNEIQNDSSSGEVDAIDSPVEAQPDSQAATEEKGDISNGNGPEEPSPLYDNYVFEQDKTDKDPQEECKDTDGDSEKDKDDNIVECTKNKDENAHSEESSTEGSTAPSTSSPVNDVSAGETGETALEKENREDESPMSMTPTTTPTPPPSEQNTVVKTTPKTTPPSETKLEKSGLNLNMTAAQMREKLAAKKKFDPRTDSSVDIKKKYQIIQNL